MNLKIFIENDIMQSEINIFYSLEIVYTSYNHISLQSMTYKIITYYCTTWDYMCKYIVIEIDAYRAYYIISIIYIVVTKYYMPKYHREN